MDFIHSYLHIFAHTTECCIPSDEGSEMFPEPSRCRLGSSQAFRVSGSFQQFSRSLNETHAVGSLSVFSGSRSRCSFRSVASASSLTPDTSEPLDESVQAVENRIGVQRASFEKKNSLSQAIRHARWCDWGFSFSVAATRKSTTASSRPQMALNC